MKTRRIFMVITTLLLLASVSVGVMQALNAQPALRTVTQLENVRTYAAAPQPGGVNYAVDGGVLFAGEPGAWTEVRTPAHVIVSAVVVDVAHPERVYIGAANELAVYRSSDLGANWQRTPLVQDNAVQTGGVTALAVDPVQHLVYAGADTAGLFRLRDVGSSMVLTAHLLLPDPVREIAVDMVGKGLLFARTDEALYRGEQHGLAWVTVDSIGSEPTALAIGTTSSFDGSSPDTFAGSGMQMPVVYVGTANRGVVRSLDGYNWISVNEGLDFSSDSALYVTAMAVDPARPDTLYAATSYLDDAAALDTTLTTAPSTIYISAATDGGTVWSPVGESLPETATALLPVSGSPGAVYALTTRSREPLALGSAADMTAVAMTGAAPQTAGAASATQTTGNVTGVLAWIVAGLAAAALAFSIVIDLRRRRPTSASQEAQSEHLAQPNSR